MDFLLLTIAEDAERHLQSIAWRIVGSDFRVHKAASYDFCNETDNPVAAFIALGKDLTKADTVICYNREKTFGSLLTEAERLVSKNTSAVIDEELSKKETFDLAQPAAWILNAVILPKFETFCRTLEVSPETKRSTKAENDIRTLRRCLVSLKERYPHTFPYSMRT